MMMWKKFPKQTAEVGNADHRSVHNILQVKTPFSRQCSCLVAKMSAPEAEGWGFETQQTRYLISS